MQICCCFVVVHRYRTSDVIYFSCKLPSGVEAFDSQYITSDGQKLRDPAVQDDLKLERSLLHPPCYSIWEFSKCDVSFKCPYSFCQRTYAGFTLHLPHLHHGAALVKSLYNVIPKGRAVKRAQHYASSFLRDCTSVKNCSETRYLDLTRET